MKQKFIQLKEALDQMDQLDNTGKPVPFDIKFISCDRLLGTGGDIIALEQVRKCQTISRKTKLPVFNDSPVVQSTGLSKDPNHYLHGTRNVLLKNGAIRKIHIRLIVEFNGSKVYF